MDRREAFNGKLAENRSEIARGRSLLAAFHVSADERKKQRERKPKSLVAAGHCRGGEGALF